jgi:hypothetical protein
MHSTNISISKDELRSLVKEAVRDALFEAGLRTEEPEHIEEARKDFSFLRRMRMASDGAASKIGYFILATVGSGLLFALWQGIKLTAKAP